MKFASGSFEDIEQELNALWKDENLQQHLLEMNKEGEKFYFLDGPPYTSGKVHIGTAWNKTMKDFVVRSRRMQQRKVWSRAGYDMHGLPTEHATMEKLGLKTKDEIIAFGLDKFIEQCKRLAKENLLDMNKQFRRMGVSLDFDNAYETMSDEWMQSVWWLVKQAHEKNRLYKGQRPMAWDPVHESACAKHELFYKSVEDDSIYVKFKRKDEDEYFIVWTTTPWTIPFNLMIMMHPDIEYCRVQVEDEVWIIAKDLVDDVLKAADVSGNIIDTCPGKDFSGAEYEHFLADQFDYASQKKDHPNVHTIVLSEEYVTTESGSGLVHAAPGCGPEDYEVGVQHDVPAFNLLDEQGYFPDEAGVFAGKRAREEDAFFTEQIEKHGHLVAIKPYVHDYPHAERSKAAVVYKATDQWFFKVDDLKEQMIAQNDEVYWNPDAGYNAFNSWLENLRDNSITKQRFWGTAFPVWQNPDDHDDYIVVGSKQELEELSGESIKDMHKPWIDDITITKDGKTYKRIPDVIDVWVDAGVAAWTCLDYPESKEHFDYFPADFIIEGNDQIRGWFNLLMVTSTLAFDKVPFKSVYMHGMINDSQGRKMSKSVGNYIVPAEVLDRFGADAVRYYFLSCSRAGKDLSYNFDDCEQKQKLLHVFWNTHKYLLDLERQVGVNELSGASLQLADRYILALTRNTQQRFASELDKYELDKATDLVESLWLQTSRTYIQLVRPIVAAGTNEEKQAVAAVLRHVLLRATQLLAPIAPFMADAMWRNLDQKGSIHLSAFFDADKSHADNELIERMDTAQDLISSILAARDRAQIGVRWPLTEVKVAGCEKLNDEMESLVQEQTNIRSLSYVDALDVSITIEPDYRALGKDFGADTGMIAEHLKKHADKLADEFEKHGTITVDKHTLTSAHIETTEHAPVGFVLASSKKLKVLLDTSQPDELINEGLVRELSRRIQQSRKEGSLEKTDNILLVVDESLKNRFTDETKEQLVRTVGASEFSFGDPSGQPHLGEDTVEGVKLRFGFRVSGK